VHDMSEGCLKSCSRKCVSSRGIIQLRYRDVKTTNEEKDEKLSLYALRGMN